MSTSETEYGASGELDLRAAVNAIVRKRVWVLACIVLSTLGFAAVAFFGTPIYRASVLLVPAGAGANSDGMGASLGQLGGLASLVGINVSGTDMETEEALAVLRSREFTERFLQDEDLLPVLFPDTPKAALPSLARAYIYFDRRLRTLVRDKDTRLITLNIEWSDPELAARWANELVRRVNEEMRSRAVARADAYVGFLENELKAVATVETRTAIGRLMEAQIKQRMLANVSRDYAFRVADRALAPDRRTPVRPNRYVLLIAGPLVGLVLGILLVGLWVGIAGKRD